MKYSNIARFIAVLTIFAALTCSFSGCIKTTKVRLATDKTEAAVGEPIQFFNESKIGFTSCAWDFGDGNTSTELNPSYAYQEAGTFFVTLVVFTETDQHFDTTEVTITGSAADKTSSPVTQEELVITLERTACFGKCPVYSLKIKGDGTVIYAGVDFVQTRGIQETTVSMDTINQLVMEFEKADYFSLKDSYTSFGVSDMPFANTSISIGGKTKAINHYLGDRSAPKQLTELENRIDEIVNSAQWIE
ncbi:MAG: PKD domain-containing protein [Chloroflexota bacterium]|nr:MAG: PKD domain-containing protein [Chloroflexota bacterium]